MSACERALAAEAGERGVEEGPQVREPRERAFLPNGVALPRAMTVDLGLDLEQGGDPRQRLLGDPRAGGGVHVEQLPAAVRPARDLDQRRGAARVGFVQAVEAGIAVSVQEASTARE